VQVDLELAGLRSEGWARLGVGRPAAGRMGPPRDGGARLGTREEEAGDEGYEPGSDR